MVECEIYIKRGMNDMFGSKKEKDKITEIDIGLANVYYVDIKTEQGGRTVFPVYTTLSESELKTLYEGYITEKGKLDYYFTKYIQENGYDAMSLMVGSGLQGPLVQTSVYFIYKEGV
jgi:hypothetical protein